MKCTIVIIVLFAIAPEAFSQWQHSSEPKAINQGRIHTTDNAEIDGQHMVLSKDSVEYYVKESSVRYAMSLAEVKRIDEYRGNHGTTGVWVGSLLGAGVGLAVALGTKETQTKGIFQETTIQTWPIYVFTLAGGLIGYAIGSGSESWGTVYSSSSGFLKKLELRENISFAGVRIGFRMTL